MPAGCTRSQGAGTRGVLESSGPPNPASVPRQPPRRPGHPEHCPQHRPGTPTNPAPSPITETLRSQRAHCSGLGGLPVLSVVDPGKKLVIGNKKSPCPHVVPPGVLFHKCHKLKGAAGPRSCPQGWKTPDSGPDRGGEAMQAMGLATGAYEVADRPGTCPRHLHGTVAEGRGRISFHAVHTQRGAYYGLDYSIKKAGGLGPTGEEAASAVSHSISQPLKHPHHGFLAAPHSRTHRRS